MNGALKGFKPQHLKLVPVLTAKAAQSWVSVLLSPVDKALRIGLSCGLISGWPPKKPRAF